MPRKLSLFPTGKNLLIRCRPPIMPRKLGLFPTGKNLLIRCRPPIMPRKLSLFPTGKNLLIRYAHCLIGQYTMLNKSLCELAAGLIAGEFSSKELTEFYLARIAQFNNQLNCFITVTPELAMQQAAHADKLRSQSQAGPLTGIPIAHKDIFCTTGVKTSCGSKMLDNFIAPYDATIVEKLQTAGCVSLGKTNMDEFAMGSSNETSYYGASRNPWHLDYVPGGSSGGSAAAISAGLVPAATGTDTGGSIRQPAAFCGITGIKPTYGRVSRFGMIAFASSLDQAGPLAATAEDCALLLQYMAGWDAKDSTSSDQAVPEYRATLNDSIQGLTLGLPEEFFNKHLNPQVAKCLEESIKTFEQLGAKIKSIKLPNIPLAIPAYYIIAPAECSSNLARYDGVRYGYRCQQPKDLLDLYMRSRSEGFGKEVQRRILIGTYVLSSGYYDAYYLQAQKVRTLIANDFRQAFADVDLIIGPTTTGTAFKIGENIADPISMYYSDIYTSSVNLAGLPAISLPNGLVNQLPVGLQLIGNYFAEAKILNAAHKYQQATTWHKIKPSAI